MPSTPTELSKLTLRSWREQNGSGASGTVVVVEVVGGAGVDLQAISVLDE
ncbi:MAG: hypothetical protein ABSD85_14945 [Acidimicrobiales bacterium]|jgi:hypothetical protein